MTLRQQDEGSRYTPPGNKNSRDPEMTARRAPAPKDGKTSAAGKSVPMQTFNPVRQVMGGRPGFLVRRLHQIADALYFEECKTKNITPVQFGVLTALSMNPWLDQKAIGRELALDRTTTAEVLKRLEEKGLIERRVNPEDRRSRLSVITKQGLKVMNALHPGMQCSQDRLIAPLSEANRALFMKLVTQVVEAHENVDCAT